MRFNKRGISAIVATVLIILITIAAVTIIWVAIIPMIQKSFGFMDSDVRLSVSTSEGRTVYDPNTKQFLVQVKRGADESELAGIKITLVFEGTSYSHIIRPAPEPNQLRTYYFNLSSYDGPPTSVSVSPIIVQGGTETEGGSTSDVDFPSGRIINPPSTSQPFGKACQNGQTRETTCGTGDCASVGEESCVDEQWVGDTCAVVLGASCNGGLGTCTASGSCSSLPIASIFRNAIAYWEFDEASWDGTPGEVKDSRNVYGVDGTGFGGVTLTSDSKFGSGAAQFDGVDDYISIPGLSELGGDAGQEVSIAAWIKWTEKGDGPYDPILTQSDASYTGYYFYVDSMGADSASPCGTPYKGIGFWPTSSDGVNTCVDIVQDDWVFVVGTRDATHFNVYVNGNPMGSKALASPGIERSALIGYDAYTSNPSHYKGIIDEVMVFNKSLTPSEVSTLYTQDYSVFKS